MKKKIWCNNCGILSHMVIELKSWYTPKQNGVSKRDNCTIMDAVRSMIYYAHLDLVFKANAVNNIVYTLNCTCLHFLPSITLLRLILHSLY